MEIIETLKKGFRKKPNRWLIPLLGLGLFHSCVVEDEGSYQGKLSLELVSDTTLVQNQTRASSLLELNSFANTADYAVEILQGTTSVQKYDRYDKLPDEVSLKPGDYTIQVSKGKNEPAAYSSPYFTGKQDFTIIEGMTTPVTVTASMANSRVTVDLSDDFIETYPEYTLSFMTNKMKTPLEYEPGSPMYFQADVAGTKLTIAMELVNVYGKEVEYTATTTIKPKQWAALTVRTDEKGINGLAVDVTLNDGTNETIYVNIGIPDFMEQLKGAPWISSEGVFQWSLSNNDTTLTVESPLEATKIKTTSVNITAGGKIANLFLSLYDGNSKTLSYDLANLSAEQSAELKEKYNMDMVSADIKGSPGANFNLEGLLKSLFSAEAKTYTVEVSVTDNLPTPNTTTKKVVLTCAAIGAPQFGEIVPPAEFEEGAYNGGDVTVTLGNLHSALKAFYFLDGTTETDLLTSSINGITLDDQEDGLGYTLTINKDWFNTLSVGEQTYSLKAVDAFDREVTTSFSVKVNQPVFEWAMAENDGDVFAKYAYLRVKANNADKVTFYQNGTQITDLISLGKNGDVVTFVWKNLSPNTSYSGITAKYNGKYDLEARSFTTEVIGTLPNAGFEQWYSNKVDANGKDLTTIKWKDYVYWDKWYPWQENDENSKGWNTVNLTTTQYGGEPSMNTFIVTAPTSPYIGCCYTTTSGTKPTDDFYTGSKAALIRTVGYGKGNEATANPLGGMGKCEYVAAGELYLGTYEASTHTPSYSGYALESRPFAVSFAYKYTPKNSQDWGVVSIIIKDKEGNTIAEEPEKKIYAQSAYNVETIKLNYSQREKAAMISIVFKSSGNSACWAINEDNLTPPSAWNLSDGEYVGSQLYIDDVELIYDYE